MQELVKADLRPVSRKSKTLPQRQHATQRVWVLSIQSKKSEQLIGKMKLCELF